MSNGTQTDLSAVTSNMNKMYRWTRHVYDLTRKYYLLGRDPLIRSLNLRPGEVVVEPGCGTARNLIKMARTYPGVTFCGFDASEEQLKTARAAVEKAGLSHRIFLAHGFAQNFDPQAMFNIPAGSIDRIVFSYALSMIPPWRESLDHALALLSPGGRVEIVDFGNQHGLPKWFRKILFWWLDLFGVHFRPELPSYIASLNTPNRKAQTVWGLRGYYFISRISAV
jgi:S-adenosylmethionine-diacylgycerolhomoserine-N-methlytransferase